MKLKIILNIALCLVFLSVSCSTKEPDLYTPQTRLVTAFAAGDFLNSLGVNSAISVRGEILDSTIECVKYLGIGWIRSGYESNLPVQDLISLHKAAGVKFSYGLGSGGSNIELLMSNAKILANAGALVAIESCNEPNNWGIVYNGENGGGNGNSWLPIAKMQRDLYAAVKSDAVLKDCPVWSPTETGAENDNVGLQYLTIPAGTNALMPDGTKYADCANCHNYITHSSWPGLHDNQTWLSSSPGTDCRVDGLYGNFGKTWGKGYSGYSTADLSTLPKVTTETGITAVGAGSEETQGYLIMDLFLSQFKRGWNHTALYLLRDRVDEAGDQTWGFYKPDYTPRKAGVYFHNLTTILSDKGTVAQPGNLRYIIPGQPNTVHDLLLQKSDGKFFLVIWDEHFAGGTDNISVQLSTKYNTIKVYDPTSGTAAFKTLSNVNNIPLSLTTYPMVIEIP